MSAGDDELDDLRGVNTELKREVARLSEEMDKIQHRRHHGKKGAKHHDAESKLQLVPAEVRIAIKQNEDLRRERLKLTAELQRNDTGRRIAETKNALAVVERKIAAAKEEMKALENQRRARKEIVDMAHHTEDELRLFRDQHRQELNVFKEDAAALTEEQKTLDRQMIAMQERIHRIQEKIKLGVNGEAFAEMQQKVASQEKEIEELEGKIAHVSGKIDKDTQRENRELKELRSERTRLTGRIEELKQALFERERELKLSYQLSKASPRGPAGKPLSA